MTQKRVSEKDLGIRSLIQTLTSDHFPQTSGDSHRLARPGPGRGLEVAHDIPPHSPWYRQAVWHENGAPGAILVSTKHLETIPSVDTCFVRPRGGPIYPATGVPTTRVTHQCARVTPGRRFRAVTASGEP